MDNSQHTTNESSRQQKPPSKAPRKTILPTPEEEREAPLSEYGKMDVLSGAVSLCVDFHRDFGFDEVSIKKHMATMFRAVHRHYMEPEALTGEIAGVG